MSSCKGGPHLGKGESGEPSYGSMPGGVGATQANQLVVIFCPYRIVHLHERPCAHIYILGFQGAGAAREEALLQQSRQRRCRLVADSVESENL